MLFSCNSSNVFSVVWKFRVAGFSIACVGSLFANILSLSLLAKIWSKDERILSPLRPKRREGENVIGQFFSTHGMFKFGREDDNKRWFDCCWHVFSIIFSNKFRSRFNLSNLKRTLFMRLILIYCERESRKRRECFEVKRDLGFSRKLFWTPLFFYIIFGMFWKQTLCSSQKFSSPSFCLHENTVCIASLFSFATVKTWKQLWGKFFFGLAAWGAAVVAAEQTMNRINSKNATWSQNTLNATVVTHTPPQRMWRISYLVLHNWNKSESY